MATTRASREGEVRLPGAGDVDALIAAVGEAGAAASRVVVEGVPAVITPEGLLALARAGVASLRLPLADAARWTAALSGLPGVGPRRVVVAPAELADRAVALALEVRADVLVEGRGDDERAARDALDQALPLAAAADLDLRLEGVVLSPPVPGPSDGPPLPAGKALLGVVRAGVALPCFDRGAVRGPGWARAVDVLGSEGQLVELLAASGVPLRDVPTAPRVPVIRRGECVVVVLGPVSDGLAVASWPGLVDGLRALGVDARLVSAWHAPHNPHAPAPAGDPSALDEHPQARAWARDHVAAFARGLDLADADVVVVSGLDWGDLVLRHPSLPAHARVVVADDHLGLGLATWVKRHRTEGRGVSAPWVLPERVTFASSFPRFAHVYALPGLPLDRVSWRLYPLDGRVIRGGVPVTEATEIVAAGNHLRRHDLLGDAVARLPSEGRPVVFVGAGRPSRTAPRLRVVAPLPLRDFVARLAASRFVVVPAAHHPERSAGNSVISLAQALGRPVVATSTPAALDHLRHGVDALVVPQDDPDALAAALRRLDEDDALLLRLSRGSAEAGRRADVAAWARRLVEGDLPGEVEGLAHRAEQG